MKRSKSKEREVFPFGLSQTFSDLTSAIGPELSDDADASDLQQRKMVCTGWQGTIGSRAWHKSVMWALQGVVWSSNNTLYANVVHICKGEDKIVLHMLSTVLANTQLSFYGLYKLIQAQKVSKVTSRKARSIF